MMRLPLLLCLLLLIVTSVLGRAKKVLGRTINDIIMDEERFVLFNSRRLTGECLSICVTDTQEPSPPFSRESVSPTTSPSVTVSTIPMTDSPGDLLESPNLIPTGNPTNYPTNDPTAVPTRDSMAFPTFSPTTATTSAPTTTTTTLPTFSPTTATTSAPTTTTTALK